MLKKISIFIFLVFFLMVSLITAEDKAGFAPVKKSDLIIDQIYVKVLQKIPNEGMKVRVVFVVKNVSSYPTKSALTLNGKTNCPEGCFRVRLNVLRNYPTGTYTKLYEDKCKPLDGGESFTFYADDFVKAGTESKYQALADNLNWIDEVNEANNEKTTSIR